MTEVRKKFTHSKLFDREINCLALAKANKQISRYCCLWSNHKPTAAKKKHENTTRANWHGVVLV